MFDANSILIVIPKSQTHKKDYDKNYDRNRIKMKRKCSGMVHFWPIGQAK